MERPNGNRGAAPASDPGADGLDSRVWEVLGEGVSAAHRADVAEARAAVHRLATRVPYDGQADAYLWYLLRYRVADMLGGRPSAEELHRVAERARAKFEAVVTGDSVLLENTLRTVFNLASAQQEVTAGKFIVLGVAALGVLLDDPEADLRAMRPHLAAWWRKNLENFRAQGILDDRSGGARRP